jgi:hypothetical protein
MEDEISGVPKSDYYEIRHDSEDMDFGGEKG